ncbi:hypothetical protein ABPG74_001703 [Tetrahymena malaccensis]
MNRNSKRKILRYNKVKKEKGKHIICNKGRKGQSIYLFIQLIKQFALHEINNQNQMDSVKGIWGKGKQKKKIFIKFIQKCFDDQIYNQQFINTFQIQSLIKKNIVSNKHFFQKIIQYIHTQHKYIDNQITQKQKLTFHTINQIKTILTNTALKFLNQFRLCKNKKNKKDLRCKQNNLLRQNFLLSKD